MSTTPSTVPFLSETTGPKVTFNLTNVGPPSATYVPVEEGLFINVFSSIAFTLEVRLRFMLASGQIIWMRTPITGAGTRLAIPFSFPLAEGYILGIRIVNFGGTPPFRGQTFVEGGLGRMNPTAITGFQTLFSDYVQASESLSFPGSRIISSLEGPGVIRSITGTVPAAGADISEVVPANARWRLVSLRAQLTASGSAGNRNPRPQLTDGTLVTYLGPSYANQIANAVTTYNFHRGSQLTGALTGDSLLPIPPDVFLPAGFKIQTNTLGILAGDQWTAPQYVVEEWIDTSN